MTVDVAERFARFARDEAPGRSACYREWASGVAHDHGMQALLAQIPEQHRQPSHVFSVSRLLGAPVADYAVWRTFALSHADELVRECAARTVQINEPLRLAPLLPVLAEIEGPIALIELGVSAGLCLYPDRYSYRFTDAEGAVRAAVDPDNGISTVILHSEVRGALPRLQMPKIIWRAGIDLAPLDARSARDREWMRALIWPEEDERRTRVDAALDIVAADPPLLIAGDAAAQLTALAAQAPAQATLVITTPGVLVYLPRTQRDALIAQLRSLSARWITIDAPGLHSAWEPAVDVASWPGFVVALDGQVRAAADPLGRWWEWRA